MRQRENKQQDGDESQHAQQEHLGKLCSKIVEDPLFLAEFQADPIEKFRDFAVNVPDDFSKRAGKKSLGSFISEGGDPLSRLPAGEVEIPTSHIGKGGAEPPWVVPVAIVAVAVASTPATVTFPSETTEEEN